MPRVSVIVTAYNQAPYIRQALDSVYSQEGVDCEVVLADDCSTDGTGRIMKEYARAHEHDSVLLEDDENLGISRNYRRAIQATRGKYVAICEGDDYWIDSRKLEKQSTYLETHDDCSFCFNRSYYERGSERKPLSVQRRRLEAGQVRFSGEDIIRENVVPNLSGCMYRRALLGKLPEDYYERHYSDWFLSVMMSQHGYVAMLPELMSVYRVQETAAWSGMERAAQIDVQLRILEDIAALFPGRYDRAVKEVRGDLEAERSGRFPIGRRIRRHIDRWKLSARRRIRKALSLVGLLPDLTASGPERHRE